MTRDLFHPAVQSWFEETFAKPTPAQEQAWPAIKQDQHTLIAAPTGSGKTLAAFMAAIDDLVREGLARGLANETHILYVSPLKALSNDVRKNLQEPLQGIADRLLACQSPNVQIRAEVRTGDTTQSERDRMRREPPHILVTTPESLFILLTSDSGRRMLSTVKSVIVDEIHALAGNKRGAHLALSLQRLQALTAKPLVRIGLSATQKPIAEMARFLTGGDDTPCNIIDMGYTRERDIAIEVPPSPMEAVMSTEVWQELYGRLQQLIEQHTTTLIFVNTRRLAERAARFLGERIGHESVTSHHGSLSREHRLRAEQRLKSGELKAMVATASLELGIDIGDVDLVCQIGSPRTIATLLQRVGRSGHRIGAIPKGRLFPTSRDDLLECTAILDAIRRQELDVLHLSVGHLDVLAQQIIAEVGCREWKEDDLYQQLTAAYPYRNLSRDSFNEIITMLAEGFSTARGRRSQYIYYDTVNGLLKPRKGAKLAAVTNAGAIPDQFDYDVVLEPEGFFIGTLNEDFAFESLPGDIFQLGNTSYRILKVEQGKVRVADAAGQPPNIPFWFGEAPGRSNELSLAVSRLRESIDNHLKEGIAHTVGWLMSEVGMDQSAAAQLVAYLAETQAALGFIPTQTNLCFERFFDEAGDQHLIIHSPYGSRLNRAWGLALRKRFCRRFNFELQAAALEDCIVLSLGPTHSFPLTEATRYLKESSVRDLLKQALLAAPMFPTHWRWNATIALAVKRNRNGRRVPAQFQRSDAEDLIAVVFPDQLACQENITGEREIPDHPLIRQTMDDCLHDVMDIEGLEKLLSRLEAGEITIHCRDLTGPSPLAQEILTARPYAFLDDAPAEERRTQNVVARRFTHPADAALLGQLSPDAIAKVREQAWPTVANADELHDALMMLGFINEQETSGDNPQSWENYLPALISERRAGILTLPSEHRVWVCAERLPQVLALYPGAQLQPEIKPSGALAKRDWNREQALIELLRGRLEGTGPVTVKALCDIFHCPAMEIETALYALEHEGFAMQGHFSDESMSEWCERGLLARIHHYTLQRLRAEIKPVSAAWFMRFLFAWHHLGKDQGEGDSALTKTLAQLEGYNIPAIAWEQDILPARIQRYFSLDLDQQCSRGNILWTRLTSTNKTTLLRNTPITLISRGNIHHWHCGQDAANDELGLSSGAAKVLACLKGQGALFFIDIVQQTGMLRTQVEEALEELAANGTVTSDSYAGLRALITPANRRPGYGHQHRRRRIASASDIDAAGRWSIIKPPATTEEKTSGWLQTDEKSLEHIAWVLLRRYGVVFRKLLERETGLPPWRELLYLYRRMEARGEIRGGRFVEGFSGEQFALPDAIGLLRNRRNHEQGELITLSAADPLNLIGIILPGDRIPALATNRILFRDGLPIAKQTGEDIQFLVDVNSEDAWQIKNILIRHSAAAGMMAAPSKLIFQ